MSKGQRNWIPRQLSPHVLLVILVMCTTILAAEIHEAVKSGDLNKVRSLLQEDLTRLQSKDETGRTPLHWAARSTNNDILALLVEKGAELNVLDQNGIAPLHSLASQGNATGIRMLVRKDADINILSPNKHTPLHYAVLGRQVNTLALLVELHADLESRNDRGRTPLVIAAREMAGLAVVRKLLDLGARIDSPDDFGDTALSLAAWRGSADVVDLLLEKKATLPTHPSKVRSLLASAVSKGLHTLFRQMAETGTDLNSEMEHGATLLHAAAEGGSVAILEILLAKGFDLNAKDHFHWTPLHFAVDLCRTAAVDFLISKGSDTQSRTVMGQSAYNIAEDNLDKEMLAHLQAKGFDRSPARFPILRGSYLGQRKPDKIPEVFAPGIISGRYRLHTNVIFSPDGKEAVWSFLKPTRTVGYSGGMTMISRLIDGHWTYPHRAIYHGIELGDVPFFHPNGTRLYDMAIRTLPGSREAERENIWVWEKSGTTWTEPHPLDPVVNNLPQHWQFSINRRGDIYFSTNVQGSLGRGDIYVARLVHGQYRKPENLGNPVNSTAEEGTPFIEPDGKYLLFERNGDICVSFPREDNTWSDSKSLGHGINTTEMELLPMVSPDGKFLFFCRNWRSYWIDASVIEESRK